MALEFLRDTFVRSCSAIPSSVAAGAGMEGGAEAGSQGRGIAQVIDSLGNPLVIPGESGCPLSIYLTLNSVHFGSIGRYF